MVAIYFHGPTAVRASIAFDVAAGLPGCFPARWIMAPMDERFDPRFDYTPRGLIFRLAPVRDSQ